MPQIIFYRSGCIGCNACVEIAFDFWRVSRKDGKANLLGAASKKGIFRRVIGEDERSVNQAAAKNCPPKVIRIVTSRPDNKR